MWDNLHDHLPRSTDCLAHFDRDRAQGIVREFLILSTSDGDFVVIHVDALVIPKYDSIRVAEFVDWVIVIVSNNPGNGHGTGGVG